MTKPAKAIMREVGAFEAKSKLGQSLDWMEACEDVIITRRGKAVARLTSPDQSVDRERRTQGAASRIRARRRGVTLGGLATRASSTRGVREPW